MDTLFEYCNLLNVNILTHTAEVALSDEQQHSIKMLKKMHRDQHEKQNQDQEKNENPSGFSSDINQDKGDFDFPEILCQDNQMRNGMQFVHIANSGKKQSEGHMVEIGVGALRNIFRREDVTELKGYLTKHTKEFRHTSSRSGVEPWTFEQKLGEAFLFPKDVHTKFKFTSWTKVSADFISHENIHECLRLTEEFRLLPKNHRAREDKLEVKKMILHAVNCQ